MTTIDQVYQFETAIETAFARVLASRQMTVYTPSNDEFLTPEFIESNPDLAEYLPNGSAFQKKRPRLEVVMTLGAGKGILLPLAGRLAVSGSLPETSYSSSLRVFVVTESKVQIHRAHCAMARSLFDTIREALNETSLLPFHSVQSIRLSGSSPSYRTQDGAYETEMAYELDFCIRREAWTALRNP
jgi:hypothetical protein